MIHAYDPETLKGGHPPGSEALFLCDGGDPIVAMELGRERQRRGEQHRGAFQRDWERVTCPTCQDFIRARRRR